MKSRHRVVFQINSNCFLKGENTWILISFKQGIYVGKSDVKASCTKCKNILSLITSDPEEAVWYVPFTHRESYGEIKVTLRD